MSTILFLLMVPLPSMQTHGHCSSNRTSPVCWRWTLLQNAWGTWINEFSHCIFVLSFGLCFSAPAFLHLAFRVQIHSLVPAGSDAVDAEGLIFPCLCTNAQGDACTASFRSHAALAMHMRLTIGGTHGAVHPHVCAAICNQCPLCRHIFASIWVTQKHLRTSLRAQRCTGMGSSTHHVVIPPPNLVCPLVSVRRITLTQSMLGPFHAATR